MNRHLPLRRRLAGAAALSLSSALLAQPVLAQPAETAPIAIPAAPLGDALRAFSVQTGLPVMFSEQQVHGLTANAVRGELAPADALQRMLSGTGLTVTRGRGGAFLLNTAADEGDEGNASGDSTPKEEPVSVVTETPQDSPELRADTVYVTGTSLRGLAPESSPLQIYTRDDVIASGVTTTEQFIRILPQNFGGGSTDFTARGFPDDGNSQRNNTFGSGANLRGLGAGATLTLVNGGRLAPASTIGDFVDLSIIPSTAIDRVEVLSDGASSVYGGDAVAGVVNLILRDDFEGAETSLRYGTVTEGELEEVQISQTFGRSWSSGNLLGTYEYLNRGNLRLADRRGIAPPTLLNGGALPVAGSIDLFPEQERQSLVLSGRQALGDQLALSTTALYSRRDITTFGIGIANTATVSNSRAQSENVSVSFLADYELTARSNISFEAGYSGVNGESYSRVFLPALAAPIEDETESTLWSAGLLANTELFELPAGSVRAAFGGQYREETLRNQTLGRPVLRDGERDIAAVFAELHVPLIGEAQSVRAVRRLELNLSGRHDDYSDFGSTTNPKIGILWEPVEPLRLRASYGTSFAPPKLGLSGALDLGVGVLPYDFIRGILNIPLPDPSLAGVNYMITAGTANDLDPETSRTFTAGFEFERTAGRHDLSVSGSFYDIRFEDRLGVTPVPGNLNPNFAPGLAYQNPNLFPEGTVIFFPSQAQIDAVLASLERPVTLAGGATGVTNIAFINNVSLTRNLASTETSGFDFQFDYGMDADVGRLSARLDASYILDFTRKASETTTNVDSLNTLYNPVDLRLRGQVGLARGNFAGTLAYNFVDSYQTDSTPAAIPIRSWSTVDLGVTYRPGEALPNWLDNTVFGLSVTNLFDRDPPEVPPQTSFAINGYDPANASPLGRFVAVSVRKTF